MFARDARTSIERAEQLLAFVGLYEKRFLRAGSLSFGQQKLLEFAMALMNEPTVLLLDEPTAGINPTLINGLIDRLKRANAEFGITLLIIEHNMRVIMNMASKIYCLAHGELLAAGAPEEIQQRPARHRRLSRRRIDGELRRHTPRGRRRLSGGVDTVISVDEVRGRRGDRPRGRASSSSTRLRAASRICGSTACTPATGRWKSCTASTCASAAASRCA